MINQSEKNKISKYNIITPLPGKDGDHVVANYLSGAVDLISGEDYADLMDGAAKNNWDQYEHKGYLVERGYLYPDDKAEEELVEKERRKYKESYDLTQVQIVFVPTYACNFSCHYCFQHEYSNPGVRLNSSITDHFFDYINNQFINEKAKPYITLFGGEPLLNEPGFRKEILYFLKRAAFFNYEIAIVTNAFELKTSLSEILATGVTIKELQITVDGPPRLHNSIRFTPHEKDTFSRIAEGVDEALSLGLRINFRVIVDKNNIYSLPELAQYCTDKGWIGHSSGKFFTAIGRSYDLHGCQTGNHMLTRSELWEKFADLAEEYPVLKKFYKPDFHGMTHLYETGKLKEPVFDSCPACKKEWAYDVNGNIYSCTASVGNTNFKLGSFLNGGVIYDQKSIDMLKNRSVFTIEKCSTCAESLSCGGGCAVVAHNNSGTYSAPDCRPVKEIIATGIKYYKLNDKNKEENSI